MGIKEQVKQGTLTLTEAMSRISPTCATYNWCRRRLEGPRSNNPVTVNPKPKKYKSKKVAQAV